jgi:hypothetical protein
MPKNQPENCQIFHQNHQIFKVFFKKITGTGSSLILVFSKNQNQHSSLKIERTTQHWTVPKFGVPW